MESVQSTMSLFVLKQRIEGGRKRVHKRPEVYVTVQRLVLHDEGSLSFSVKEFSLSGLHVTAYVEILGTRMEITKEFGQEVAHKLLKKAAACVVPKGSKEDKIEKSRRKSDSEASRPMSSRKERRSISGRLTKAQSPPNSEEKPEIPKQRSAGWSSWSLIRTEEPSAEDSDECFEDVVQTCMVDMTLTMSKEANKNSVEVRIRDVDVGENTFTSSTIATKLLGNPPMRNMVEAGIGNVVMRAFTKKLGKAAKGISDAIPEGSSLALSKSYRFWPVAAKPSEPEERRCKVLCGFLSHCCGHTPEGGRCDPEVVQPRK